MTSERVYDNVPKVIIDAHPKCAAIWPLIETRPNKVLKLRDLTYWNQPGCIRADTPYTSTPSYRERHLDSGPERGDGAWGACVSAEKLLWDVGSSLTWCCPEARRFRWNRQAYSLTMERLRQLSILPIQQVKVASASGISRRGIVQRTANQPFASPQLHGAPEPTSIWQAALLVDPLLVRCKMFPSKGPGLFTLQRCSGLR